MCIIRQTSKSEIKFVGFVMTLIFAIKREVMVVQSHFKKKKKYFILYYVLCFFLSLSEIVINNVVKELICNEVVRQVNVEEILKNSKKV